MNGEKVGDRSDALEQLKQHALYMSAWNYPCHIVDLYEGVIVHQVVAYNPKLSLPKPLTNGLVPC